jgi:hypothetical protein
MNVFITFECFYNLKHNTKLGAQKDG